MRISTRPYGHKDTSLLNKHVSFQKQALIILTKNYRIMAQTISTGNFEALVATGKPLVLDFWATWCGPCRRLAPVIEELAKDYEGIAIVGKCDVEEDEDLAMRFGVRNIPTVVFIKGGEEVDRSVGLVPRAVLEDKLKALL